MSPTGRLAVNWIRRVFLGEPASPEESTKADGARVAVESRCRDLESRLTWANEKLRERSENLYDLQQIYSSEHFELQESMRNLKIERMRNAGAFADRDVVLGRAQALQNRIRQLKERLKAHETVEDEYFDDAPLVATDTAPAGKPTG